jgi:hypothetical protein
MSDLQNDIKSLRELINSGLHQASVLLSNELALARAEIKDKISQLGRGAAMIIAGAVLLMPALTLILLAIATGVMALGLSPGVSYLVTGVGAAILAGLLTMVGLGRLSGEQLKPKAMIHELRRDGEALREMVR